MLSPSRMTGPEIEVVMKMQNVLRLSQSESRCQGILCAKVLRPLPIGPQCSLPVG